MYAVIVTGGKQYRVKEGDVLSIEKLEVEPEQQVDFDQVLLIEDGKKILVGTPVLGGAVVRAVVLETYKDDKVVVFKKKRRKQYRRTKGHRQQLTKVRVEGIALDGKSLPALKIKPKKAAPIGATPQAVKPKPAAKPEPGKKPEPEKKTVKAAPKKATKEKAPSKKPAVKKPAAKTGAKTRKTTKE